MQRCKDISAMHAYRVTTDGVARQRKGPLTPFPYAGIPVSVPVDSGASVVLTQ